MEIYLVGGAVRDELLGRQVRERDWLVVGAHDGEMEQLGFRLKDPNFPVYLHPESGEEYALARKEQKRGSGYKGFATQVSSDISLQEDLARRDLSINAIARSSSGEYVDPFNGRADLQARRLRHVTAAFVEDPLRVLRLARFNAELAPFGFNIDQDTERLAAQMCANGELSTLSPGRIWRETARALASSAPIEYFAALLRWDALGLLFGWLNLDSCPEQNTILQALHRASVASSDSDVRFASLVISCAQYCSRAPEIPQHWPVPASARELVGLCMQHALPAQLEATQVFDWFVAIDAWRRDARYSQLLLIWRAVLPQAEANIQTLQQACKVSKRVAAPQPGSDPGEQVRACRLAMITEHLQNTMNQ